MTAEHEELARRLERAADDPTLWDRPTIARAASTIRQLSRDLAYWRRENEKGLESLRYLNRTCLDHQAEQARLSRDLEEARGLVRQVDEWLVSKGVRTVPGDMGLPRPSMPDMLEDACGPLHGALDDSMDRIEVLEAALEEARGERIEKGMDLFLEQIEMLTARVKVLEALLRGVVDCGCEFGDCPAHDEARRALSPQTPEHDIDNCPTYFDGCNCDPLAPERKP